jgi:hypothetical protein
MLGSGLSFLTPDLPLNYQHFSGECSDSELISTTVTKDEFSCLKKCHETGNCSWITFVPDVHCLLMTDCNKLDATLCPSCVSGQKECSVPTPTCFVEGECEGEKDSNRVATVGAAFWDHG